MDIRIVNSQDEGLELAKNILYKNVDKKTVLFLSGGNTPKPLYKKLAEEEKLQAGAVAMVDERFGPPMHSNSNELMVANTGFFKYCTMSNIPVYQTLKENLSIEETARQYDETVHYLFEQFKNKIAILGIGSDGHTASIPPCSNDLNHDIKQKLVIAVNDFPGEIKERITLTFKALSQIDYLIVIVFGKEKKKALKEMFKNGSIEQIPARFFVQKEISQKTILITDQRLVEVLD